MILIAATAQGISRAESGAGGSHSLCFLAAAAARPHPRPACDGAGVTPHFARARSLALLVVSGLVALLPFQEATAHADFAIVDEPIRLEAGSTAEYTMAIHFHRLVGAYNVHDSDTSDLTLLVVDDASFGRHGATVAARDALLATELSEDGRINELIECCFDAVYTPFHLLVRNDGATPAALDLRAWAVHDDFAVVVHRAEPGAMTIPLSIFLALAAAAIAVAVRQRSAGPGEVARRIRATRSTRTHRAFWWSLALFVGACSMALALGVAGALRYQAGPVDGMVAIVADLPLPGGPFGSRGALVMGLLLLTWISAIALWIRSVHLGAYQDWPGPALLGAAIGIVSIVSGAALGWTYGRWPVPVGLGLVLGVPLIAVALSLPVVRSATRTEATATRTTQ